MSILAPAIYFHPSRIGPRTILPQLRVDHFLLPYVLGSMHGGHRAQMGPKVCHGTYSKVRPSTESYSVLSVIEHPIVHVKVEGNVCATRTIDGPPVSEYPGVGEYGHQYCRNRNMCIGALTPGAECENSLQGEEDCNSRLWFVRVCSCSSLCFCDSEGIHILANHCSPSLSPQ